jgi:CheY-like chemotaxis protein
VAIFKNSIPADNYRLFNCFDTPTVHCYIFFAAKVHLVEDTPAKQAFILYMDDDKDDIELLHQAIGTINSGYQLITAPDGEKGLALLRQKKMEAHLPTLIVLDINMPRLDGRLTFKRIREDRELANIPVVIFSTSNSPMDKLFFQNKNVEYITKPIQFEHLVEVAKRLLRYCKEADEG